MVFSHTQQRLKVPRERLGDQVSFKLREVLDDGTNEGSTRSTPETCLPGVEQPTVLCIDDDPEISRVIDLRLQDYGVNVLRAYHGMHGFWLAMTERPDVIITDINMPQGEGDYVVECLKRNSETNEIPIFVLSGTKDESLIRRMITLGVERYLTKPLHLDELTEALKPYIRLTKDVAFLART